MNSCSQGKLDLAIAEYRASSTSSPRTWAPPTRWAISTPAPARLPWPSTSSPGWPSPSAPRASPRRRSPSTRRRSRSIPAAIRRCRSWPRSPSGRSCWPTPRCIGTAWCSAGASAATRRASPRPGAARPACPVAKADTKLAAARAAEPHVETGRNRPALRGRRGGAGARRPRRRCRWTPGSRPAARDRRCRRAPALPRAPAWKPARLDRAEPFLTRRRRGRRAGTARGPSASARRRPATRPWPRGRWAATARWCPTTRSVRPRSLSAWEAAATPRCGGPAPTRRCDRTRCRAGIGLGTGMHRTRAPQPAPELTPRRRHRRVGLAAGRQRAKWTGRRCSTTLRRRRRRGAEQVAGHTASDRPRPRRRLSETVEAPVIERSPSTTDVRNELRLLAAHQVEPGGHRRGGIDRRAWNCRRTTPSRSSWSRPRRQRRLRRPTTPRRRSTRPPPLPQLQAAADTPALRVPGRGAAGPMVPAEGASRPRRRVAGTRVRGAGAGARARAGGALRPGRCARADRAAGSGAGVLVRSRVRRRKLP